MGIMGGLLIPNEKFNLSTEVDSNIWKSLLGIDYYYINLLKDARFIRSNDLLYVYCTEYSLQDVVGAMHPNNNTFASFKLRMSPYLQKFYCECVAQRLSDMFGFYKGAIEALIDNEHVFYGSKVLEDSMVALSKASSEDSIFDNADDMYLILKNYLKNQINQTTDAISNEIVSNFVKKLETMILTKNDGMTDDQLRRKYCRILEIANLFLQYTKCYVTNAMIKSDWSYRSPWGRNAFDNSALVNFENIWQNINARLGNGAFIQKGLPYRHIDIDAAVCIFPETTEYPLLKEEFTKQNRPVNPISEHIINDWMLHWYLTNKLADRKKQEDNWKKDQNNL